MAETEEQNNGCHLKPEAEAFKRAENVAETERKMMTPWEQHSAVISIPRFDYNAPSALLHRCQTGFLITCTISENLFYNCLQYHMFLLGSLTVFCYRLVAVFIAVKLKDAHKLVFLVDVVPINFKFHVLFTCPFFWGRF